MKNTVAQMSQDELKEFIENVIEEKIYSLLGDSDEGLEIKENLNKRFLQTTGW